MMSRLPERPMSRPRQRGMSLLEVLVSVLIFSFGLLGLLALQGRAVQFSASAEDTGRAALLANELSAQMWAARSVTLPAAAITAWQARVAAPEVDGLPDGSGSVVVNGTVAEITISWRPPRAASTAENRNRYTTQVMVQ
jgi:type IV pilus assembly protein PilV